MPFRPFGRGTTPLRRLTNHGYYHLLNGMILQVPKLGRDVSWFFSKEKRAMVYVLGWNSIEPKGISTTHITWHLNKGYPYKSRWRVPEEKATFCPWGLRVIFLSYGICYLLRLFLCVSSVCVFFLAFFSVMCFLPKVLQVRDTMQLPCIIIDWKRK